MIVFNNLESALIIAKRAGMIYHDGVHSCIARIELTSEGKWETRGGVIFTDYNFVSIQGHMASAVDGSKWINKEVLFHVFNYVFNICACKKWIVQCPASNEKALALDLHFGFSAEARIEDVLPDGAMLILGMYREQCRFLKVGDSSDGKKLCPSP